MDDVINASIELAAIAGGFILVIWAILSVVRFAFGTQLEPRAATAVEGLVGVLNKRRFFAFAIDNAVAGLLAFVSARLLMAAGSSVQFAAAAFVYVSYFFLFEGLRGRTPGKYVCQLRVVGLSGDPMSFGQAAVRTAFRFLEANPLLLGAVPAGIAASVSKRHQRFGDMLARTVVVSALAPEPTAVVPAV
jgi:uncharacterized RDD family membrane protein YckC